LLLEKVVQHAFVTGAFAMDAASLRADAPFDYRWFLVSGGLAGVLFAAAFVGQVRGERRSLWLAAGLAVFDIVGEFVYQGGLSIVITVSLIAAVAVLVLAVGELRRTRDASVIAG
jgi:uncharacterized membrane protein